MKKFLLVDGSNLLFQMFYGMPSRILNKQGKAIHGVLGFTGALIKILRAAEPDHVLAVFDGENEDSRKAIYSGYKSQRTDYRNIPESENPFSQLYDVYTALDFMGIKHFETRDCEADELIAGYALELAKSGKVIISSSDSDFFQLISDRISVLRYSGGAAVFCTPEYVTEKFGIAPEQYADFKALTGDKSDNIKGAEGIGIKTAAGLLGEYGNLENIIENPLSIKKPSVRASIMKNSGRLILSRTVIKLGPLDSLPLSAGEFEYSYDGITANEVMTGTGLK